MSKTADAVMLINRLIQRTSEGSLDWTRGLASNEFQTQSGGYRFVVGKDIFSSGFKLQVYNAQAQMVEEFRSDQNPFEQSEINMMPIKPRLQALWATVSGSSDELKKILKSI